MKIIVLTALMLFALELNARAQVAFAAQAQPASAAPSSLNNPSWMQNHEAYVSSYWHNAFAEKPSKSLRIAYDIPPSATTTEPSDVYVLGALGTNWQYGVTNNYDVGACVERDIHYGQWLAGGCKDVFYVLRYSSTQNAYVKGFHIGGAYMQNAEQANSSFQLKAGIDLGTLGATLVSGLSAVAPVLSDLNITLPPWTAYVGDAVTFDFAAGYAPNIIGQGGHYPYGPMVSVNVPVATTFEWLIQGL